MRIKSARKSSGMEHHLRPMCCRIANYDDDDAWHEIHEIGTNEESSHIKITGLTDAFS